MYLFSRFDNVMHWEKLAGNGYECQQEVDVPDDEVLAAAILDRLLFKCEIVKLSGKSYRLENRKTIFENNIL